MQVNLPHGQKRIYMPSKSVCAAASAVMKSKNKYKPDVVKMANFAKNFGCSK